MIGNRQWRTHALFEVAPFGVAAALLVLLLLAGCGGDGGTGPAPPPPPPPPADGELVISGPASPRQGDVVEYSAELRRPGGGLEPHSGTIWSLVPSSAGLLRADGRFVGYGTGGARIIASGSGARPDTLSIELAARGISGSFEIVGQGVLPDEIVTTDLWVHGWPEGDFAYTASRNGRVYVWDVTDPAAPTLTDSVVVTGVAARNVNDVKIRADGALGVHTHEQNGGITLFDLSDPASPEVITRYEGELAAVHNVWVEGDYVYEAQAGSRPGRVVDISDPAAPVDVGEFYGGSSFPHDVYVREGLAFVSHFGAGLVIFDVGNGMMGGSPESPVEVGRVVTQGEDVHNAWYWPDGDYVFVGEEDFETPGVMHVVDVRDLTDPVEVATFGVDGDTPHNFWLDEEEEILYMAWLSRGVRALDVSGELLGDLGRQGREVAGVELADEAACFDEDSNAMPMGSCVWAPQLHAGHVFASDMVNGLWVLRLSPDGG